MRLKNNYNNMNQKYNFDPMAGQFSTLNTVTALFSSFQRRRQNTAKLPELIEAEKKEEERRILASSQITKYTKRGGRRVAAVKKEEREGKKSKVRRRKNSKGKEGNS